MDVNTVLTRLAEHNLSLPVMKLVWNCQLQLGEDVILPKLSPSYYNYELQMSTIQRHMLLNTQQKILEFWGPGLEFTVVPSILVFQQYQSGEVQSVSFTVRNISGQIQKIHLRMEETNLFSFDHSNTTRIAKFASGLTVTGTVRFTPDNDGDYFHKLIVATDHSSFVIPIVAIGGRPILDLPDNIHFGVAVAVKYLKQKIITVCNSGSKDAKFTLNTDGPFSVSPEKGVLAPGDSFNMFLSCYSETLGCMKGHLCVKFDNGEEIYTHLLAEIVNKDIDIKSSQIIFPNTYMGFKVKERLTIRNNSNTVLKFSWKRFGVRYQRLQSMAESVTSKASIFNMIRRSIVDKSALDPSEHRTSIVPNELHVPEPVHKPEPLFRHKHFTIEPLTGSIQPRSTIDITIIFTPTDVTRYEANVYLDITGQEERIPVYISGVGLGPKFKFGFGCLDIGEVYIGTKHMYEIPVTNTSEIKGSIAFISTSGLMPELYIQMEPRKIKLAPGHFGAFYVHINPIGGEPRDLLEELKFHTSTTGDIHTILLKGKFIVPPPPHLLALHLQLDGGVSYGKSNTFANVNDTEAADEDEEVGHDDEVAAVAAVVEETVPLSIPTKPKPRRKCRHSRPRKD